MNHNHDNSANRGQENDGLPGMIPNERSQEVSVLG